MTFLDDAPTSPAVQQLYDDDRAGGGFVMELTRLWAHHPAAHDGLFALLTVVGEPFSMRERGILVAATAATLGDAYCSLAWGTKLSEAASPEIASAVLDGSDSGLDDAERALAGWARKVVNDPNVTTRDDVEALRAVGYGDEQIFALTAFVALRLAFSTVNDALGAAPDAELVARAPREVAAAVTWGRASRAVDQDSGQRMAPGE